MDIDNKISDKFCIDQEIAYFDYAATTFMPQQVIEKWVEYQKNVGIFYGKGYNKLSIKAIEKFNEAESIMHKHFGIDESYEFIYGKNTTEVINIVALGIKKKIKPLDYILVGPYEHHSNLLPWKYLAKDREAIFLEMPLKSDGNIDWGYLEEIKNAVKVVSFSSVSNISGFKVDLNKVCEIFDKSYIFVDESQQVAHKSLNTNNRITGYFLTSHKMYGPKNIAGALIKKSFLEDLEPTLLGGGMVNSVGLEDVWADYKHKFEAGTIDIGLIRAWAEACIFLHNVGYEYIEELENYCYLRVREEMEKYKKICILDSHLDSKCMISFVDKQIHAHDVEYIFSKNNIIIRSGNLCAQPSIRKLEEVAINRISFGLGVSERDLDRLCKMIRELQL